MLGYVNVERGDKVAIRKCNAKVTKVTQDSKVINIYLNKKFDLSKDKDINKILKIFKKEKIDSSIFQKQMFKEYKSIVDSAYTNDINIITGNLMYTNMVTNIVKYIFDLCKNVKLEEIHLGIAMDLISYNKLEFIKHMADSVRGITILTTATSKYDNLCKEILADYGLVIKCTDNFKSGLKECDLCINFDMNNSDILGCISNKCILINLNSQINKMKKAFKGIVINDIDVDISDIQLEEVDLSQYRALAIAQAHDEDNTDRKILSCIGINGEISEEEFEKFKIFKGRK